MKQRTSKHMAVVSLTATEQTLLGQALAREDFDYAARLLVVGAVRALDGMPADSLEGLLDAVIGGNDAW